MCIRDRSKIKNSGLDQYGTEPFEQQQFGTAGAEGVKEHLLRCAVFSEDVVMFCILILG